MGRPALPIGSHGTIRLYPHPHPAGSQWRATTKYRDEDGKTRPVSRIGKSRAAATRELQRALTERRRSGASGDITGETRLKVVAPLWLVEVKRLRSGTTYDTYRRALTNRVLPALGDLQLNECTVPVIHRYLRAVEQELAANSVRTCRTVVSGILAYATQQGAISVNPVRDAGRIEGGGVRARALTQAEREDFLRHLDTNDRARADDLPDLVRFMLGTGVRIGEALALRWGQVDLDAAEAVIGPSLGRITGVGLTVNEHGKTKSALRLVPLPDFVVLMLRMRVPAGVLGLTSPVFPNTLGGWRDPNNTQRSFRKARAAVGYGWVTSHSFRRTAITILDEQHLSAREIAGHVGHSRPSVTLDTYMDLRARGRSAADALDSAMRRR